MCGMGGGAPADNGGDGEEEGKEVEEGNIIRNLSLI